MGLVKASLFLIGVISVLYLVQVCILLPPPTDRDLENRLWWRRKTFPVRRKMGLSYRNDTIDFLCPCYVSEIMYSSERRDIQRNACREGRIAPSVP